jgi:hypothetical protein
MQKQYVNGELVDLNPNELKGVEQLKADAVETDKKKWIMRRQMEYPSIADQLDDIYHNGVAGWKTTIKATKDKYPKG